MKKSRDIDLAGMIDHTYLKSVAGVGVISRLCGEADEAGFASVCVNPSEVAEAARLLRTSAVKVCTVVDFPLGQSTLRARAFEAMDAIQAGADELDLVVNQTLLKNAPGKCEAELLQWVRTCRTFRSDVALKLILECCNLSREEIRRGSLLAEKTGFDFVKTSTGFGSGGATVEDVELMRRTVGAGMGVKAAGGIRDRETALAMVAAGATRIGTSAGKSLLV
jgi:deoxyribose-phosphate aldolase